jgi:cytochrome bd-type quinol oxidase subunit 2
MSIIQEYIKYINDNPHGYWFKRKLYGWGWTPVRWQGWVVIGVYVVALLALALSVDKDANTKQFVMQFVLPLLLIITTLIIICYRKGEKPKWQWGSKK